MRTLIAALLRAYQAGISPLLGPGKCRFEPSCSHYAHEAVLAHGTAKGLLLMGWRLLRCQPLCRGGFDPVPPRHRWKW